MSTILLVWELGGGIGHLVNLLPLARELTTRGHRVYAAIRDLSKARKVFADLDVCYLQAPYRPGISRNSIDPPRTFAHILHAKGFGDVEELATLTEAWRHLYDFVQPDLIVFDHSPTGILAARGCTARQVTIGTGFFTPVDQYPLPNLRPSLGDDNERLRRDEDLVLRNMNETLLQRGEQPLERVAQLYTTVDETFLVTFQELDHYPYRNGARYWGAWPNVGGKRPTWPTGSGQRIYAYLKPFPNLPHLLAWLNQLACPTLIYVDGIDMRVQQKFQSATLVFENERLDLSEVGDQCDLAILNGNHGTTVSLLLAGKPTLQLPLYLEQAIFSQAVERIGAGLIASAGSPDQMIQQLAKLLENEGCSQAAQVFSDRYADFDPDFQIAGIVDRIESLAAEDRLKS